jgi:hypothetical protein
MPLPQRLFNIVWRMTGYGLVLGGANGLLVILTILLFPSLERPTFYGLPLEPQPLIMWGGLLGVLYGTVAGFISGFGMTLLTAILFREVLSVQHFRWFMGSTTFMLTIATFVGRGLWGFGENIFNPTTWNTIMLMSIVIAIYASQRTATKYLLDCHVPKVKL